MPPTSPGDRFKAGRVRRRLMMVWAIVVSGALAMVVVLTAVPPLWLAWLLLPAVPLALHDPSRRTVARLLRRLRHPSPRATMGLAAGVGLTAIAGLFFRAHLFERWMGMRWHDEFSYRIGTLHLSIGRLWLPAPQHAEFFDTFHVLVEPVYSSIYWPGTALLNVPGVWLGLPVWGVPILLYGASVGLVYRVTRELIDGQAALLAAVLAAVSLDFIGFATRVMAQGPTAFLGIAAIYLWLRWRGTRGIGWLLAIGAVFGLLAITRPVDGLAFAVPLTVAILWRSGLRRVPTTMLLLVVPTLPFLALQATLNVGTTGKWYEPPYVRYLEQAQPGTQFLAEEGPAASLMTDNPKKQELYQDWLRPMLIGRLPLIARVERALDGALPGEGWLWLVLIGAAAMVIQWRPGSRRGRLPVLVLPAGVVLFMLLYLPNPIFLEHYAIPLAVLAAPVVALGVRFVERGMPRRFQPAVVLLLTGGAALAAVATFADPLRQPPHPGLPVDKALIDAQTPADNRLLVFVPYRRGTPHVEIVYNVQAARIEDNTVVWAHDLGERNVELINYFRLIQPDRRPMRLNLDSGQLEPLAVD